MSVTIFGTGAMAMLFGARLARSGVEVRLAGTWREALEAIAARGIAVEEPRGSWSVRPGVVDLTRHPAGDALLAVPPAALVLVLVKSHQTAGIAPLAARAVAGGGTILTLQNGLTGEAALAAAAGASAVAQGVTRRGATVVAPGRVRDAGGGETVLPATLGAVGRLFEEAGFAVRLTPAIESEVWRKVAVNCAINPLTALHGVPNGALLERAEWREALAAAAREVGDVARARKIEIAGDLAREAAGVASLTAANRSSMLQDLERGAPTEIDALCGAVVQAGRESGVPTPVNRSLWRRVRRLEARRARDAAGRPSARQGGGASATPHRRRRPATEAAAR